MTIHTTTRRVEIPNEEGLHLRAAAMLAEMASQFQSDIRVRKADRVANGKSILDLLGLVAERGSQLTLEARGPDSQAAINALAVLIYQRF